MNRRLSSLLLVGLISLSACGQKRDSEAFYTEAAASDASAAPAAVDAQKEAQLSSSAITYTDAQRQFVRTANVKFRVKDVYQSALAIENLVAGHGGFVTLSHIGTEDGSTRSAPLSAHSRVDVVEYTVTGQLVVRIPSARTQEFLRALAGQVEFLQERHYEVRDVQFDLLLKRLQASRAEQTQKDLGAVASAAGGKLPEKAETMTLRDYTQNQRDEALVAQKLLEDQVAFSTLTLSLYQTPILRHNTVNDIEAAMEQYQPSFGSRLLEGLQSGWKGFLSFIVFLVSIWPITIGLILIVFAARQRRKQARLKRQLQREQT